MFLIFVILNNHTSPSSWSTWSSSNIWSVPYVEQIPGRRCCASDMYSHTHPSITIALPQLNVTRSNTSFEVALRPRYYLDDAIESETYASLLCNVISIVLHSVGKLYVSWKLTTTIWAGELKWISELSSFSWLLDIYWTMEFAHHDQNLGDL